MLQTQQIESFTPPIQIHHGIPRRPFFKTQQRELFTSPAQNLQILKEFSDNFDQEIGQMSYHYRCHKEVMLLLRLKLMAAILI